MFKITYCMRRLPNLTREEFQTYYRRNHTRVLSAAEAGQLAMRRYVQLHAYPEENCEALEMDRGGETSFDAVAEIWLDDLESWKQNWNSEAGRAAIHKLMDDEQKFIDWKRSVMTCSRELVLIDGPSTPAREK